MPNGTYANALAKRMKKCVFEFAIVEELVFENEEIAGLTLNKHSASQFDVVCASLLSSKNLSKILLQLFDICWSVERRFIRILNWNSVWKTICFDSSMHARTFQFLENANNLHSPSLLLNIRSSFEFHYFSKQKWQSQNEIKRCAHKFNNRSYCFVQFFRGLILISLSRILFYAIVNA